MQKFFRLSLTLLALACIMMPISGFAEGVQKVFNAKSFTLDNGLELIVVENHRAPVVTHMAWYRAGAADEPLGKSGIAHFLEHLLFKGHTSKTLGTYKAGEFSKIVRSLGGEDNAFTSQDYTAYYQSIASEHLETVMRMEAGRMRGLNPPLEAVASENKVIQEERRQRTDNDPRAQAREQANASLFPNHPYGTPVIGWMHEIQELSWDDAKSFYDQYYVPNNAIVIISGAVKAKDALEIAKRTYGTIAKSTDMPERKRTTSPPFIAQSTTMLRHPRIQQAVITNSYRVPSERQNRKTSLALQVLDEIVGGGSTSRLYKSLVIDQKVATDVSMSYSAAAWDDGVISVSVHPKSVDQIVATQDAINAVFQDVIDNGVTDEELKDAITRMQADAIYARDSLSGPAMIIGYNIITGSTLENIEHWPQDIARVTKDEIQKAAKRYLNPKDAQGRPAITTHILPPETSKGE